MNQESPQNFSAIKAETPKHGYKHFIVAVAHDHPMTSRDLQLMLAPAKFVMQITPDEVTDLFSKRLLNAQLRKASHVAKEQERG